MRGVGNVCFIGALLIAPYKYNCLIFAGKKLIKRGHGLSVSSLLIDVNIVPSGSAASVGARLHSAGKPPSPSKQHALLTVGLCPL